MSNVIVRAVVRAAETANPGLALNRHPNGRPDIVARAVYPGDAVKRGSKGIEVKASRYRSGWRGHNAEPGWLLIVQFDIDTKTEQQPTSAGACAPVWTRRTGRSPVGGKRAGEHSPRRSCGRG